MGKWIGITVVIALIAIAGVGFGAYTYGQQVGRTQAAAIQQQFFQARGIGGAQNANAQGGTGQGRQFNADNFTAGQVKSISGNTIELSTAQAVVKVQVTDKTQIQKQAAGALGDIQQGERITVQGTKAADGTMQAQTIQIGRAGIGPGGGTNDGSTGTSQARNPQSTATP